VPLEVGIVGLPGAGKSTLFQALTRVPAGHGEYGKPQVGIAAIPDERLSRVAAVAGSAKATPASLRLLDVPGLEPGSLGTLRQADALVGVLNGFAADRTPDEQAATIELELLVADQGHVERRRERVTKQAKSGDPALRDEADELERVLAHLEAERPLRDYPAGLPPELEPLTTKPLVWVVNGGPGGIDLKLEVELAELPEAEAAAFRDAAPVLDEVVRRVFAALDAISFFTANENEARAWTLRRGQTALEAAAAVHSDLARGFVRCEAIRWDELAGAGSQAEAARRGLVRIEGKDYVVSDGDVLTVRFSPPR
jgi:ribosome-binding ATPase YchF (GTP1/OBG family)